MVLVEGFSAALQELFARINLLEFVGQYSGQGVVAQHSQPFCNRLPDCRKEIQKNLGSSVLEPPLECLNDGTNALDQA